MSGARHGGRLSAGETIDGCAIRLNAIASRECPSASGAAPVTWGGPLAACWRVFLHGDPVVSYSPYGRFVAGESRISRHLGNTFRHLGDTSSTLGRHFSDIQATLFDTFSTPGRGGRGSGGTSGLALARAEDVAAVAAAGLSGGGPVSASQAAGVALEGWSRRRRSSGRMPRRGSPQNLPVCRLTTWGRRTVRR